MRARARAHSRTHARTHIHTHILSHSLMRALARTRALSSDTYLKFIRPQALPAAFLLSRHQHAGFQPLRVLHLVKGLGI
jgi:hypothetical protein